MQPNSTPWVDRTVRKYRDALADVAPSDGLPYSDNSGKLVEFGCGHYGCVMPTGRPDVVFKLTTDPAEAAFVRVALEVGGSWWPPGMIRYDSIYRLAGASFRKRPVFALWRQEATDVGETMRHPLLMGRPQSDPYERRQKAEASALLANAQVGAAALRDWLKKGKSYSGVQKLSRMAWRVIGENFEALSRSPHGSSHAWRGRPAPPNTTARLPDILRRYRGAERAAIGLRTYDACAEMMDNNSPLLQAVGSAMSFYRQYEIVLADVHEGNLGLATHEDYDDTVITITDPGHAVFLDDRYDDLSVPELG